MKAAGIILVVLVLAAVCAVGYLYLNANLEVRFVSCVALDGISQLESFNALKKSVESSTFVGTRFSSDPIGTADQYQFLEYTVALGNHAFLNAEVIEMRITPMQGDVLQIGEQPEHDLASGRETQLSAIILTSRNNHSVREATVSCYFWGIPFTTKLTLGK
jgi:hypothetical protein